MTPIVYNAPPTVGEFMCSTAFFRLIAGPIGSGKTTGCLFELLRRAGEQQPGRDGIRRTRFAILRTTLSQIKMTILKDIIEWFREIITYKVSENLVIFSFGDVYSEWYLIPLEDPKDQQRLLSMQLTGAFMSEVIETRPDLIGPISGRCGRYPSGDSVPTWHGIIADTNFPTMGSDWHKLMEMDKPANWEVFKQPGGLDPNAENLNYLLQTPETVKLPIDDPARLAQGRTYYENLLVGDINSGFVQRYVHAQYGEDPSGTAVYARSFKYSFHSVDDGPDGVALTPGMILLVGQDFGRNPCSLIAQLDNMGRLNIVQEVIAKGVGLETHIATGLKPALFQERFAGYAVAAVGDPSGAQRSSITEENHFMAMGRMGIPCFPAVTNDIDARHRAVEQILYSQRGGGPALRVSRQGCPKLVLALNGAYRYANKKDGNAKPTPEKDHPWSDLADCLQYLCLAVNASLIGLIAQRIRPATVAARPKMPTMAWT